MSSMIKGLFGGEGIPEMPPPPPAPQLTDKEVQQAKVDERRRLAMARNRKSTILTGEIGAAPVQRKTLLGQ